jgi:RecA-family ATPase
VDDDTAEIIRYEIAQELCRPPTIVGAREVLAMASARPAWLVPEMVPAKDLTLITGAPGAKKSWLAYALALAVAQGQPWVWSATAVQGRVLALNYDNSTAECGRRFKRLGMQASDPVLFHSLDMQAPLRLPEKAKELTAIVDHLRPTLVLVDSLRQAHTADENSSKEMMVVMAALKRLYACGAAVVVVHHSGKTVGAASKSRGSEEIDASATAVIHVAGDTECPSATWAKHRSWHLPERNATRHFRVIDVGDETRVEAAQAPERRKGPPGGKGSRHENK